MNKLLAILIAGIIISSCQKSNKRKVTGTWKQTMEAYDDNGNQLLDEDEKVSASDNIVYSFKSDGSLDVKDEDTVFHCTWELKDDNMLLLRFPAIEEEDKIVSIDNNEMLLQSSDNGEFYWAKYQKQ